MLFINQELIVNGMFFVVIRHTPRWHTQERMFLAQFYSLLIASALQAHLQCSRSARRDAKTPTGQALPSPSLLHWLPQQKKGSSVFIRLRNSCDALVAVSKRMFLKMLSPPGTLQEDTVDDAQTSWASRKQPGPS